MEACGNVGTNSVFYSFGARTKDARPFCDSLDPQGTMFNDALDADYVEFVIQAADHKYSMGNTVNRGTDGLNKGMNRQDIYLARALEAFAQVSTDTAYLVILDYNGDPTANAGGQKGAFQNPLPPHPDATGNPNVDLWLLYELPTLQRNVCILRSPFSLSRSKACLRCRNVFQEDLMAEVYSQSLIPVSLLDQNQADRKRRFTAHIARPNGRRC